MTSNQVDLSIVTNILDFCVREAADLHGQPFSDNGKKDSVLAERARRINHLADMLILAGELSKNEYWIGKGFDDPTAVSD